MFGKITAPELMQQTYKKWFANVDKCRGLGLKEIERRAERSFKRKAKKLELN